ncbi:MAG TPA: alpha/beta hydrolase [Acidimicrobiales bacterium]|nr:alpha/beta hydrolase [Acidimicrobiales bacterium]
MRTRTVHLGDVSLEVFDAGEGGRPVLLVHGFTADSAEVADVVDPLAERGWHAVAPDLRGHGASDRPTDPDAYSFELMAADVLALADHLGWDRFVLLGHSMGGAVAQLVALEQPERLAALILVSTFHGPVPGITMELVELGRWVVRESGMTGLAEAMAARRAENPDSIAAFERLQEARPDYAEESRARLEATSPDMWMALAPRFVAQDDRLDRLAKVDVPTAVIVGDLDSTMLDDCRRLAETIPGATLTVIAGAGHVPQLEQPDAWWDALSGFLDRLPSEGKDGRAGTIA